MESDAGIVWCHKRHHGTRNWPTNKNLDASFMSELFLYAVDDERMKEEWHIYHQSPIANRHACWLKRESRSESFEFGYCACTSQAS